MARPILSPAVAKSLTFDSAKAASAVRPVRPAGRGSCGWTQGLAAWGEMSPPIRRGNDMRARAHLSHCFSLNSVFGLYIRQSYLYIFFAPCSQGSRHMSFPQHSLDAKSCQNRPSPCWVWGCCHVEAPMKEWLLPMVQRSWADAFQPTSNTCQFAICLNRSPRSFTVVEPLPWILGYQLWPLAHRKRCWTTHGLCTYQDWWCTS